MKTTTIARPLEFDLATLPWLDRYLHEIDAYLRTVENDPAERIRLRGQLLHWMQHGYVVLEQAVPHELIDAYLADVADLFRDRSLNVMISSHYMTYVPVKDYPGGDYHQHGLRIIDFHNSSIAGKKLSLNRSIVRFLNLVFRAQVVAMQSLTFMKGTQQEIHQDFAYVIAEIPSHLAASWIALEDIDPRSGPLMYYPGSHTAPAFDWGDGMFRTPQSTRNDHEFALWIQEQARRHGLELKTVSPRKGDVFIWHGGLAHGGSMAQDLALTRKSYVTHYSTAQGFTHDYRAKDRAPHADEINGALIYRHPHRPAEEDHYRRGAAF